MTREDIEKVVDEALARRVRVNVRVPGGRVDGTASYGQVPNIGEEIDISTFAPGRNYAVVRGVKHFDRRRFGIDAILQADNDE